VWRKRFGGGMRQIGILAAAGHFALDNNIDRLKDDHVRARSIAHAAHQAAPSTVNPDDVDTNIVVIDLAGSHKSAAEVNVELKAAGILASALGPKFLRLVTHLGIDDQDVAKVNAVLPALLDSAFKLQ